MAADWIVLGLILWIVLALVIVALCSCFAICQSSRSLQIAAIVIFVLSCVAIIVVLTMNYTIYG